MTSSQPRRPYVPYKPNQDHYLAVADLYVRLVEAERARELTLLDFKAEPYCWRTFGNRTLQPDAFVQVGIEQDGRRLKGSFFIEVDRGDQWGTKISSKFPQYVAYWHDERASYTSNGQAFPRILLLAPTLRRVAYLTGLIAEQQSFRHLFRAELLDDAVIAIGRGREV